MYGRQNVARTNLHFVCMSWTTSNAKSPEIQFNTQIIILLSIFANEVTEVQVVFSRQVKYYKHILIQS